MKTERAVAGPWSLATSRAFWAGFAPAALRDQPAGGELRTVFLAEPDWTRVTATVRQDGPTAHLTVDGPGDLEAAADQVARFLSLDVDGRGWPAVGERDPVIGEAQRQLPGFRPCGFHSPYEAAVWAVLTQRVRMSQARKTRADLIARHGHDGAFPDPARLRSLDLDLFGRQTEYLHAVAEAALDGLLDGARLRKLSAEAAVAEVKQVKGLGLFASELVALRGANHPDGLPRHEPRLAAAILESYGSDASLEELSAAWRPYRTWASVYLRALA
ncbi:DNA-3-methyladenine glycosylase [Paractinoplanes ferrugineus]|uniref:DNA-3-methyladenine glycosylase II n=1 Tax=Paractinoplanes ferrugineus TaxID=113564 RepID=A0A919IWJ3_9ACTN|nr:hypothetical protein [Actinoplanes ferrugineus]GIE10361.1 DNA-3-methyladenine glycosylase II [Actinoplanes ferrugineus]